MTEETMDSGYDLEAEAGVANDTADHRDAPPFLAPPTDPLVALLQKVIEQQEQMAKAISDLAWQPDHPDYEREREQHLRHTALEHAVQRGSPMIPAAQVVSDAGTFLAFLKGESAKPAASSAEAEQPWGLAGVTPQAVRQYEIAGTDDRWRLFSTGFDSSQTWQMENVRTREKMVLTEHDLQTKVRPA